MKKLLFVFSVLLAAVACRKEDISGIGESAMIDNGFEWASCNLNATAVFDPGSIVTWDEAHGMIPPAGWRVPAMKDWERLIATCIWSRVKVKKVSCLKGVSRVTGEAIYLPLDTVSGREDNAYYWCCDEPGVPGYEEFGNMFYDTCDYPAEPFVSQAMKSVDGYVRLVRE